MFFKLFNKALIFIAIFMPLSLLVCQPIKAGAMEASLNDIEAVEESSEKTLEELIDSLLSGLNLDALQDLFDKYGDTFSTGFSLQNILSQMISGAYNQDYSSIISAIMNVFMTNIKECLSIIFSIFSIILLGGLISKLEPNATRLGDLIFCFSYALVAILVFSECANCFNGTRDVLTSICKDIERIFPILLTLVSICGGKSSAMAFKPTCVFVNSGIIQIVIKILFPILTVACVISVVSSLNERNSLKNLRDLFFDCFKWVVGITIAIFTFFITTNSFGAATYDSLSLRAIKYAVGNGVPIIGGFAKEGVDLVIASGALIKNAVGGVAIAILFFALLSPFVSILALSLSLKLLSAMVQPFSDTRICDLLNSFSKIISYLSVLIIMIFVAYFVTLFTITFVQSSIMVT